MTFRKGIRRLINASGYDLRRLSPRSNPSFQLLKAFERFQVDLVFDVGANQGQFSLDLRAVGYKGKIVSFEPLSEAYAELKKNAAADRNWLVHRRAAIGDRDGQTEFNIAGNSVSSSVLPMLESHSSAAQNSAYVGTETVLMDRLDAVAPEYLQGVENPFLKIDTQGYEWQVLDGAEKTLAQIRGLYCELSLVPLYEGQRLWLDLIRRLEQEGFVLWALQRGFTDPRDGRTLQMNAVFFREAPVGG